MGGEHPQAINRSPQAQQKCRRSEKDSDDVYRTSSDPDCKGPKVQTQVSLAFTSQKETNAKLKKEGVEGLQASDTSHRKKIEESLYVHRAHRLGGARLQAGQYKASLFKSCQSGRPSQLVGRVYRLESEFEGIKTTSSVPWASRGPLAAFCIHGGPPGLGDLPLGTGSVVACPLQGNP